MTKECFDCDCYDSDFGCTMPSIDLSYACLLFSDDNDFNKLDSFSQNTREDNEIRKEPKIRIREKRKR